MKLKYAYAAVPCHNKAGGVPLQRSRITTTEENEVFIIAIEDTVQQKENPAPKKGPKLSNTPDLEFLMKFITERFDLLWSMTEEQARRELIKQNTQKNTKQGSARRDAAAPLLMAAIKNGRYLLFCCGDGIAGLREGDLQKRWSVLNQVQHSLEIEESEEKSLNVFKGLLEKEFMLVLLNSGACVSLYNRGEEGISPACSTFGEWLKEYDGETVSEALTENIEKYFIKETQGDICVAVVVPETGEAAAEEEAETVAEPFEIAKAEERGREQAVQENEAAAEEAQEQAVPETKDISTGKATNTEKKADIVKRSLPIRVGSKRVLLAAAVLMITAAVIIAAWLGQPGSGNSGQMAPKDGSPEIAAGDDQEKDGSGSGKQAQDGENPSDQNTQERDLSNINPAEHEPMISFTVNQPAAYEPGFYRVGQDLPAGEYFFWTGEMIEKDSIEINGETALSDELYCMTVQVEEGETLSSNYRFTSVENVNPIRLTGGILISGKYRIGKDIAPGEYEIFPEKGKAPGRYYSVLDGKISNNTELDDRTTVTVPEEGYIVLYRSYLAVPEE
ncbi:MAG: hypothetical protein K0R19_2781 [Bacillota bacterium]|nr:hypothetical protein [Bacillota bacterium]